jgi:hypothetical protein
LPCGVGDVVQVGEGQRRGNERLDEHRVDASETNTHARDLLSVSEGMTG